MKHLTTVFESMLTKPAPPIWSTSPTTAGPTQCWTWGG